MAVKNVAPPFKFFDAVAVATPGAGGAVTSSITSILNKDNIGLQYSFTGPVTGTIDVQGSIDYNPGLPESAGGLRSGTWTSVSQVAPNALPVTVSSGTSSVLINMDQLAFAWLRTQYTNSSGSGTLTGWFCSKSLG